MTTERLENVWIFVLGTLDKLLLTGLVAMDDDAPRLTNKGRKIFARLTQEGFEPSTEEITMAVTMFRRIDAEEIFSSIEDN